MAGVPEIEGEEGEYGKDIKYLAVRFRAAAEQNEAGSSGAKP
jgi:hypothetical protein